MNAYNIYFTLYTLYTTYQTESQQKNITSQSKTKCLMADYAKAYACGRPHTTSVLFHCRGTTDAYRYMGTSSHIGDHAA